MSMIPIILASITLAITSVSPEPPDNPEEAKWHARLPKEDRSALKLLQGYEIHEFPEYTSWVDDSPGTFASLRGKVVLVQTFTTRSTLGRGVAAKLDRALGSLAGREDLQVILVHTPDGVEKAPRYFERVEPNHPVALDKNGVLSDGLGAYKRPVNILVGRQGNVRYAGLTEQGAAKAVEKLLAETYDPTIPANERPEIRQDTGEFPTFTDAVRNARDLRGQRAPDFFVKTWVTAEPNGRGKVAIIDFWATWCGPCVAAIPHMNEIQKQFASDVICVGISDEQESKFHQGLNKRKLNASSFNYALGLDDSGSMKSAFQVKGIPHVVVISSDWIVRWQGHPTQLTPAVLNAIVSGNRALGSNAAQGGPGKPPSRWQKSRG
ncbi:MAG: TlpA family protein disulfide reductase [Phycisphaerales bacterium]|nr:TlpA family protein disulfide reductase [Phycisphaerales bacterium]